jgi:hypothetical protein
MIHCDPCNLLYAISVHVELEAECLIQVESCKRDQKRHITRLRRAEAQAMDVQQEINLMEVQIHEKNGQANGLRATRVELEARSLVCVNPCCKRTA